MCEAEKVTQEMNNNCSPQDGFGCARMLEHKDKTLEQLDGDVLGLPEYDSALVLNCHRLRRVPLNEFTAEDLRLMIGQDLSLEYLMPIAIEHLEKNPFVDGDYHPGDLLKNVLGVRRDFWEQHPEITAGDAGHCRKGRS